MAFIAQQRGSLLYLSSPLAAGTVDETWVPVAGSSDAHRFPSRTAARETISRISGGRLADYKITRAD